MNGVLHIGPRHPGPPRPSRRSVAVSDARKATLRLEGGIPLDGALALAFGEAGCDSGWVRVENLEVKRLGYLLPAPSDGHHAAWYSEERTLSAPGRIHRAGLFWGRRDGVGFAHCHGIWAAADGAPVMGHLLAASTVLARAATVPAWLLPQARFDAQPDAETGFTLFEPVPLGDARAPDAALLRVAPGQNLCDAIPETLRELGWRAAQVEGLGSLEVVRLADGRCLHSPATEILVLDSHATPEVADIQIEAVGVGGSRLSGRLAPRGNPVLITAELVLRADHSTPPASV